MNFDILAILEKEEEIKSEELIKYLDRYISMLDGMIATVDDIAAIQILESNISCLHTYQGDKGLSEITEMAEELSTHDILNYIRASESTKETQRKGGWVYLFYNLEYRYQAVTGSIYIIGINDPAEVQEFLDESLLSNDSYTYKRRRELDPFLKVLNHGLFNNRKMRETYELACRRIEINLIKASIPEIYIERILIDLIETLDADEIAKYYKKKMSDFYQEIDFEISEDEGGWPTNYMGGGKLLDRIGPGSNEYSDFWDEYNSVEDGVIKSKYSVKYFNFLCGLYKRITKEEFERGQFNFIEIDYDTKTDIDRGNYLTAKYSFIGWLWHKRVFKLNKNNGRISEFRMALSSNLFNYKKKDTPELPTLKNYIKNKYFAKDDVVINVKKMIKKIYDEESIIENKPGINETILTEAGFEKIYGIVGDLFIDKEKFKELFIISENESVDVSTQMWWLFHDYNTYQKNQQKTKI